MTSVYYQWVNEETGEVRMTKSLPEARSWVENEGGSYNQLFDEKLSKGDSYCMPGAAKAIERWKNYKY